MRRPRSAQWFAVAAMTLLASAGTGALAPAQAEAPTTLATSASARNLDTATESVGRYVALGDSYAAGPLIPLQTGQPAGCLRSNQNYPSVLANSAGADVVDVSCSGAKTDDFTDPQPVQPGPNPPQFDALDGSEKLVTLTIGGNDIGFADIIQRCATVSPTNLAGAACRDSFTKDGEDELTGRIDGTASKVADALDEIRDRAPGARVAVVGYPTILPDTGPGCFPIVPFSAGDVAYLRGVEKQLNGMLEKEAADAGVDFVDTYTPTIGHDVCQLPPRKWVEGLVPTSPAAPVHPNAQGERAMAAALGEVVGVPVAPPAGS
ncbi:SGNH/GDSL hydrolase family protein [Pseudonocardia endophytica]|uniref:GDSL-like lipase/acylhydrolase family protein n=1 Tax=Pseudonocardia endophytica TaxID=401976 RepID=A0A4R1HQA2_PSEEN|nr:SGNH/GDSL hydrolase family protein [Pseudonocardia endophytica]TCK24288.1 GDSL-like lipase/acylhydrolase family protein [Pseudonocardia endophytica]